MTELQEQEKLGELQGVVAVSQSSLLSRLAGRDLSILSPAGGLLAAGLSLIGLPSLGWCHFIFIRRHASPPSSPPSSPSPPPPLSSLLLAGRPSSRPPSSLIGALIAAATLIAAAFIVCALAAATAAHATTYAATAPLAAAARASPSAVALVADALAVDLATLVDAGSCGGPVRFMGQKKRAADARSVCGTYIMSVIEIIYEL